LSRLASYRSRIRGAVRSCLSSSRGKVGAFLSGGTDSSTIVGVLRELTGEAPHAYSIGFAIEGYDESSYARTAAAHFGADHHQYVVTPRDVAEALPRIAEAYDEPFGNSSAVASYHCAELARADGVGTMLGGDGGDEIFAGNERYAKQAVFDYYLRMPAALRHLVVEPLLGILPRNGFSPLRKAQSYVRQANTPLPDRLEEYNFVTRMTPAAILKPEFLAISPNNRIPAIVDREGPNGKPISLFESGAILIYLAGKTGKLLPSDLHERYAALCWLMWQMGGVGPMFGQANHFRAYSVEKISYAIERYTNEANRLTNVLDKRLGEARYLAGDEYSIADIAVFPWMRNADRRGINLAEFPHAQRWLDAINARPAVQRALQVLSDVNHTAPHDEKSRDILFGKTQFARR